MKNRLIPIVIGLVLVLSAIISAVHISQKAYAQGSPGVGSNGGSGGSSVTETIGTGTGGSGGSSVTITSGTGNGGFGGSSSGGNGGHANGGAGGSSVFTTPG